MKFKDSDYVDNEEITSFLYHLRTSEPTHYGNEDPSLINSFKDFKFVYFSTKEYPPLVVIKMCIAFVTKLAAYTPGSEAKLGNVFYISMPLAIWCSEEGNPDRTLVWTNGGVTLTPDNRLILFIDSNLAEKLLKDNK